jgi:hypothetical protein
MLRIQGGDGAGAGLWIGSLGTAIALATAARIALEAPVRTRPRVLLGEAAGALAGLYAAYLGVTGFYEPGANDVIAVGVAALAAPALAIPRPPRLRPLIIIGLGAFLAAFLGLADLGETGTRALIAGLVMMVAGGFALYQRTAGP